MKKMLLLLHLLTPLLLQANANSCNNYSSVYGRQLKGVCVCNSTQCHTLPRFPDLNDTEAVMFSTSKAGKRFVPIILAIKNLKHINGQDIKFRLKLDPSVEWQSLIGFGGSFTDAAAINVYKMKPAVRERILDAYYGDFGLQYTLGRVPIASTDFSLGIYSYNDNPGDLKMEKFSINVDKEFVSHKLTLIKEALSRSSREMALVASPWAPPRWMTNENTTVNCHIKGYPGIGPHWAAWALYFSKFLTAYKQEGIDFWAVTSQNEPVRQPLQFKHWQSHRFNATTERDWIKYNLGPQLKNDHPDVLIISMDDQKDQINKWSATLDDPVANEYVSGTGFHWYTNIDFSMGGGHFNELERKHNRYLNKFLLATEACEGFLPPFIGTGSGVRIRYPDVIWTRAENYARDIINDLLHWAVGWTDWNIVLDRYGGPSWAANFVDAPILVDSRLGEEFYKQPMYYIMGHFSKYLPRGSKRINIEVMKNDYSIDAVAFHTPVDQFVVVLQHRSGWKPWKNKSQRFLIQINRLAVEGVLEKDSVVTIVIPSSSIFEVK